MKVFSHITFVDMEDASLSAFELIGKENLFDFSDKLQAIELETKTRDYSLFIRELKKSNIKYDEQFTKVFDQAELLECEYLNLLYGHYAGFPQPENKYREICFDVSSACQICGNGAKQKRPLFLKRSTVERMKEEVFCLNWVFEYIVSDRIADLIRTQEFSGCKLWPVLDFKTKDEIPGWKQIYFDHDIPPMAEATVFEIVSQISDKAIEEEFGISNPALCKCGKLGRNKPDTIYYNPEDAKNFLDFNHSYEWLGGGNTTYQLKIVSNRVFKMFLSQKITTLFFEPIFMKGNVGR